jgi:small subunit ribosomal protein S6
VPYYETMFIVRPDAETELVDSIVDRVEELVRQNEGITLDCEVLGIKRLAYEVKKCQEGIYVKLNIEAPTAVVDVLKHYMRLSEDVMLNVITRTGVYLPVEKTEVDKEQDLGDERDEHVSAETELDEEEPADNIDFDDDNDDSLADEQSVETDEL